MPAQEVKVQVEHISKEEASKLSPRRRGVGSPPEGVDPAVYEMVQEFKRRRRFERDMEKHNEAQGRSLKHMVGTGAGILRNTFALFGLSFGVAQLMKQSRIMNETVGAAFTIFGAMIDSFLAPFMPMIAQALVKLAGGIGTARTLGQEAFEMATAGSVSSQRERFREAGTNVLLDPETGQQSPWSFNFRDVATGTEFQATLLRAQLNYFQKLLQENKTQYPDVLTGDAAARIEKAFPLEVLPASQRRDLLEAYGIGGYGSTDIAGLTTRPNPVSNLPVMGDSAGRVTLNYFSISDPGTYSPEFLYGLSQLGISTGELNNYLEFMRRQGESN